MSDRTATTKVEPHGDGSLTITVHVEAEDAENIVEAARARGVSVPEWVYHCLVIGVQSREIAREVLAQV